MQASKERQRFVCESGIVALCITPIYFQMEHQGLGSKILFDPAVVIIIYMKSAAYASVPRHMQKALQTTMATQGEKESSTICSLIATPSIC